MLTMFVKFIKSICPVKLYELYEHYGLYKLYKLNIPITKIIIKMNTIIIKSFCLIIVLSFLTILFTFGGCSSGKSTTGEASLEGTEWVLEMMNGKTVAQVNGKDATLKLDGSGKISGNGSCNSFFGSYKTDGTAFSFGEIGSTKMMCDEMSVEMDYFAALKKIDKHEIKSGKLNLYSASSVILVFKKK